MKKLLLFFLPIFFMAQTHRYIYEFKYKPDSLSTTVRTLNMALDINPTEVKFYPYQYVINDSLNKRGQQITQWIDVPALIRKINTGENVSFVLINDGFYTLKTIDKIDWKLSQDTKNVLGYELQKATTDFGGRHWIAWFAKESPFDEGPYKFRGLPGMIFEIHDDHDNFSFSLLKSQNLPDTFSTKDVLEKWSGRTPIPIDYKTFVKKQLESYNSPLNDVRQTFMDTPGYTFIYGQTTVHNLNELKTVEDQFRMTIRKENNPIELDKAIHYPIEK